MIIGSNGGVSGLIWHRFAAVEPPSAADAADRSNSCRSSSGAQACLRLCAGLQYGYARCRIEFASSRSNLVARLGNVDEDNLRLPPRDGTWRRMSVRPTTAAMGRRSCRFDRERPTVLLVRQFRYPPTRRAKRATDRSLRRLVRRK